MRKRIQSLIRLMWMTMGNRVGRTLMSRDLSAVAHCAPDGDDAAGCVASDDVVSVP